MSASGPIGGDYCLTEIDAALIAADGRVLTAHEMDVLWRLFQEIGRTWDNVIHDSANLKSSWLEFIRAKTGRDPDYAGEYANAVSVVEELVRLYGEDKAYTLFFLGNGIPDGPPTTQIAHAKQYVVDEFIRMQVLASGFKSWGGRNYKGYIAGSRYNRVPTVRAYAPDAPVAIEEPGR